MINQYSVDFKLKIVKMIQMKISVKRDSWEHIMYGNTETQRQWITKSIKLKGIQWSCLSKKKN